MASAESIAERLERFDFVVVRMPKIAEVVNAFDPDLRQQAYYTLLGILDPEPEPYVLDLLDAFLTGSPLNFHDHPVPAAVQNRLLSASADGKLRAVPVEPVDRLLGQLAEAQGRRIGIPPPSSAKGSD